MDTAIQSAIEAMLLDMELGPVAFIALAFAAFATSILSAIIGMAGGITLLSLMLLFYDPLIAIPIHGVVQLVSNSSRAVIQRNHLRWPLIWRYGLLLIPMGFVGIHLAQALPPTATRRMIGAFVLLATFAPNLLLMGAHPERSEPNRRFFLLGGVVGLFNVTIGATGPLIAPFFLNLGLDRFALIGTKAACQVLGHLGKIFVFGAIGFAYSAYLPLLITLSLCVVVGTMTGSRLLHRVDERWFVRLYKIVLTAVALSLLWG
jgi:uncharacterized membrane protein YfcA